MTTRLSKLTVAVLAAGFACSAFADDHFSGVYTGAQVGYVTGDDKGTELLDGVPDDWTQKTSPNGGSIGAFVGFNKVLANSVLIGVESDYESRHGSDQTLQMLNGVGNPAFEVKSTLKDAGSIRAKLGYVFNDGNTLAYVTGGYAAAEIKRTFIDNGAAASESHTKWHDGWTTGLGIEHFIKTKISVKAEYRYSEYSHETVSSAQLYGPGSEQEQKYENEQSVRVGLAYHF